MGVYCGVFILGVFGPNAAMELGRKNLFIQYSTDRSNMFFNPFTLTSRARLGSFSHVADSKPTK
jgi:hypothetical protein